MRSSVDLLAKDGSRPEEGQKPEEDKAPEEWVELETVWPNFEGIPNVQEDVDYIYEDLDGLRSTLIAHGICPKARLKSLHQLASLSFRGAKVHWKRPGFYKIKENS